MSYSKGHALTAWILDQRYSNLFASDSSQNINTFNYKVIITMNTLLLSKLKLVAFTICLVFLSACATTETVDERDPWEGFNRGVYAFNEATDKYLLDHISKAYDTITPDFIDNGISNFFSNLGQIPAIANDLLQLKFDKAVNDLVRFIINSTWGILGFNDIVGSAVPKGNEDFGQTLAHWGIGSGPYVVLPFFGPSTIRDTAGFAADTVMTPTFYLESDSLRAGLFGLNYVDFKSDLLSAKDVVGEAAVDEYEFLKNAFFEKRRDLINDGAFEDFPVED